ARTGRRRRGRRAGRPHRARPALAALGRSAARPLTPRHSVPPPRCRRPGACPRSDRSTGPRHRGGALPPIDRAVCEPLWVPVISNLQPTPVPAAEALFERARSVIPGGVNSPVRAYASVGGNPRFIARANGPYLIDADGNELVDLVGSWGPMLLGHAHPEVVDAVTRAAAGGTSYGAPTEPEVELAAAIVDRTPVERVRLVNSGTEATMTVLRLARGVTGRDMVVKFAGCYHGHVDALLVQAGSGVATLGIPGTPGVTEGTTTDTLVLPYGDTDAVAEAF